MRLILGAMTLFCFSFLNANSAQTYEIQNSSNDETFVINGEVFKAKTYCFSFNKGDKVIFVDGNANGACASAKIINLRNSKECRVWCE